MRYMLLMCGDGPEEPSPDEIAAMPEMVAWLRGLQERGGAAPRDGGYGLVECADLDEAIEVAAEHPNAVGYAVEIRPFWEG
jgi:hypothetical protein